MTDRAWDETIDLPAVGTWLLEASAGTGKTHQIAGIFVRLVAEYGIFVDRILTITFTNAATAELRDRIRSRLREALDLLRAADPRTADAVMRHLLARTDRTQMAARLERAILSFDLAPISTIHGFSQRMLQEFAFDSGQDTGLEPMADPGEVVEQVVDDSLATLYQASSREELALHVAAGMTRKQLVEVARRMCGPTEPRVLPAAAADWHGQLGLARAWVARTSALRQQWHGEQGQRALAQLVEDASGKQFKQTRAEWVRAWLREVGQWLDAGAAVVDRTETWFCRLRTASLREKWKGTPAQFAERAWVPLFETLDEFCDEHDLFWTRFAPLAVFARSVRARVEGELARRRALTFDGMLSRLAERITHDGGCASRLAERIRGRFHAALVDEFQDTDEAQWRVIEAAFHGHRPLLLIGDPKQAIYAFRGADVHVYLAASKAVEPSRNRTMGDNWRSDPRSVHAMNALWRAGSQAFNEDAIDYVAVRPNKPDRLEPETSGLEVRWMDGRLTGRSAGEPMGAKEDVVAARLAAREAVAWLAGKRAKIVDEGKRPREVEPRDLAVLVGTHDQGRAVRDALERARIPSVAASQLSVFDTPVAGWLAAWLDAVAGAGRDRAARNAAVQPLFGWTADELAWALAIADRGDDAREQARAAGIHPRDWNAWTERLRAAEERWQRQGFARTFDREATDCRVLPRVVAMPEGERHATDLRHLVERLHVEQRTRRLGPRALSHWVRSQAGLFAEANLQRLESDAFAVKIETVHVSKGLEYPIVLLPFAWSARQEADRGGPIAVRGSDGPELVVHAAGPARSAAHREYCDEQRREDLRKLYVALTRGRHRTTAWYGPVGSAGQKTSATPLGRLLMRDPNAAGFDDDKMPDFGADAPVAWSAAKQRLDALVRRSERSIEWVEEEPFDAAPTAWTAAPIPNADLRVASWPAARSSLGGSWLVASFSGLVGASAVPDRDEKIARDGSPAADEVGDPVDRASEGEPIGIPKPPRESLPDRPRLSLGRGKRYGTWVHGVLERVDFRTGAPRDGGRLRDLLIASGGGVDFGKDDVVAELEARLPDLLSTPLDSGRGEDLVRGLPEGFALRDVDLRDRLDELVFDLRLGGGTCWRRHPCVVDGDRDKLDVRPGCVDPRRVYDAILSATDCHAIAPWLDYQRARRDAGRALVGSISGILTGSIDLVFRASSARDGATRYFLADYKTNRIEGSMPGNYAGAWLEWEMARAGYPLQALIYTLALHRHLSKRLRGYDYDKHVGGYVYLFLRGMSGRETPRHPAHGRCLGVFGDRWPKHVVEALDEALSPREEAR